MGSCNGSLKGDQDGIVMWYPANSYMSMLWQDRESGFGYRRVCSYRDNSMNNPRYNRNGNTKGELAGKIVFYSSIRSDSDYRKIDSRPVIKLNQGDTLFAKAFFNVPLGRVPIGQNNIKHPDLRGEGAVLLASRPRAIAVFIDVDGERQTDQLFCPESQAFFDSEMKETTLDPKPKSPSKAIPGSFFTFLCAKEHDPYCFLHLPLIGSLSDTSFRNGPYVELLTRSFTQMLTRNGKGAHHIEMAIRYYYDHIDFNCLVLGEGTNALGRWNKRIPNCWLKNPHELAEMLQTPKEPIARGSVTVELAPGWIVL